MFEINPKFEVFLEDYENSTPIKDIEDIRVESIYYLWIKDDKDILRIRKSDQSLSLQESKILCTHTMYNPNLIDDEPSEILTQK